MDFSVFSNFDHAAFQWIQENIWCGFLDKLMPVITVLGEGGCRHLPAFQKIPKSRRYNGVCFNRDAALQ